MTPAISLQNLYKRFEVREMLPGFKGTLKSLFRPKIETIAAIKDLNFQVQIGERVAFIGPNGAGKSTTIKMLTGILHPSSGGMEVLGLLPWQDRHKLGFSIGTVFGQRSQLWYHLPASDTFFLLSKIYELDSSYYKKRLHELTELFELQSFITKPVRQLSLGERMRCELVASLLHKPKILFLDEPTIGLDINAKLTIRHLLNKLSEEEKTTLFLTSHDMADIEEVADRVLILDKGTIVMDSSIRDLKRKYVRRKIVTLITDVEKLHLSIPGIKKVESENYHYVCEIDLATVGVEQVLQEALKVANLRDMTIEDPSMEEIIREIYGLTR